ncbi:MAG: aminopeptidase P family protein [Deltaproteobacteria bacterium]|nr:aminopeptidase P family protein [Deltaproteobacteria bacterium]
MNKHVPLQEINSRMERFRAKMDRECPDWQMAAIFGKLNQYYFTGTMQDGMLLVPREDEAVFWVRQSIERALDESHFSVLKPMKSYRDATAGMGKVPDTVYLETEVVPLGLYRRFQKYFPFKEARSVDFQLSMLRAVKSDFELDLMRESGEIHRRILEERVPSLLREGVSEAEFAAELYVVMMEEGHHGLARMAMFQTEIILGNICFGESSIYPTYFNGPGGNLGLCPAVPLFGSRERKLRKGDLVFIDIGCGVEGYHTDKTMTYVFGGSLSEEVVSQHQQCVDIQNRVAARLKPGEIPSKIFADTMNSLKPDFLENFMGFGERRVKFLGHGIGLAIDEIPVIAEGFDLPMEEGMAFALEPKKGVKDIGMVGIENTFLVTSAGGECITGDNPGLMKVY